MSGHRYIQLVPPQPGRRISHDIAQTLLNQYFNVNLSRSRWKKQRPRTVKWWQGKPDAQGVIHKENRESKPISLDVIENILERKNTFPYEDFNLFNPFSYWLDSMVSVAPEFHIFGSDGKPLTFESPTTLGENFPLKPAIDREGQLFNSFQLILQKRILFLRRSLVEESYEFKTDPWFQNLRSYVSECVSLIDTTLHQLYFKAQYAPLSGWKFEPERLGKREGQRLKDKLKWVYQITGNALNADEHIICFVAIKNLRNHLQHFDPPCFCFTLEHDVVQWMNSMQSIAQLAWEMRKCMGASLSVPLIEMLLEPKAQFVPRHPDQPRLPITFDIGYASTQWQNSQE